MAVAAAARRRPLCLAAESAAAASVIVRLARRRYSAVLAAASSRRRRRWRWRRRWRRRRRAGGGGGVGGDEGFSCHGTNPMVINGPGALLLRPPQSSGVASSNRVGRNLPRKFVLFCDRSARRFHTLHKIWADAKHRAKDMLGAEPIGEENCSIFFVINQSSLSWS